jgi:hypothetical protein
MYLPKSLRDQYVIQIYYIICNDNLFNKNVYKKLAKKRVKNLVNIFNKTKINSLYFLVF